MAVLRECAAQRTGDAATLLSEREHAALVAAIELDDPILRACACMGAAAGLLDPAQARFWRKLPATLAAHVGRVAEADLGGRAPMRAAGLRRRAAALATERPLYAADAIVREATQRLQWHERAHGGGFGEGEGGEEDAEARFPDLEACAAEPSCRLRRLSPAVWHRQTSNACRARGCTTAACSSTYALEITKWRWASRWRPLQP